MVKLHRTLYGSRISIFRNRVVIAGKSSRLSGLTGKRRIKGSLDKRFQKIGVESKTVDFDPVGGIPGAQRCGASGQRVARGFLISAC